MIDLQALMNGMSAQWQRERAETQMTLGKLIDVLSKMAKTPIAGLGELRSYRGYYDDLAFEPTEASVPASAMLKQCKSAMGQVFTGYKGGEFVMGARTPLWVADYGCTGERLMAINADGSIVTAKDDDE